MGMEQDLRSQIRNILAQILDLPGDSIEADAHIMSDLGGDSWQYLEFRTELERIFRVTIPDAEVDRLSTVEESARLLEERLVGEGGPAGGEMPVASIGKGACRAGEGYLGEDGAHRMDWEIDILQMGGNGLAEAPLMKLMGNLRWAHLNQLTGVPAGKFVDEGGHRVFPAFYYLDVRFPRQTPMASFGEGGRITIVSTMASYANSVLDGYSFIYPAAWPSEKKVPLNNGYQAEEVGIPYIRSSGVFVRPHQGAGWLKKAGPVQPGVDNIPKIAEVPDSYLLMKKAAQRGNFGPPPEHFTSITPETLQCEYRIEPDRDLNGLGLLCFSNYPVIQDIAERRLLADGPVIPVDRELLDLRTVVSRQSAYLANAPQTDTILISMDAWMENPYLSDHPAPEMAPVRLFMNCEMIRRSDGRRMLVSQVEKVIFGKTLEEAGLLEPLKKLAG